VQRLPPSSYQPVLRSQVQLVSRICSVPHLQDDEKLYEPLNVECKVNLCTVPIDLVPVSKTDAEVNSAFVRLRRIFSGAVTVGLVVRH